MALTFGFYLVVWGSLLATGWRNQMWERYPLFYLYLFVNFVTNSMAVSLLWYWKADPASDTYLVVYLVGIIVVHAFGCAILLSAYRFFSDKFRFSSFALPLLLFIGVELLFAPYRDLASNAMHVTYLFEAYCGYRAGLAALTADIDAGWNWKAIIGGLFLSSSVLVVNYAGSLAAPALWPYSAFAAVSQAAWMAMWIIFLIGMSRYSPPEPVFDSASQKKEAVI